MASLTWIGGGNNDASNPADWSPAGLPKPGDVLTMNGGTMHVKGNALHGDLLFLNGSGGSVSPMATYTLDLSGNAALSLSDTYVGYGLATVNIARGGEMIGTINVGPYGQGGLTMNGGTWDNNGQSGIDNIVVIDSDVVGTGTILAGAAHFNGSKIEFMQSVGHDQTVVAQGGGYGNQFGTVQIDDPKAYHADTVLGFAQINLEGLHASSYSFANGKLNLFAGNRMIDSLKLTLQTPVQGQPATNFGVSQVGGSVIVHADGVAYVDGGTLLPLHG